MIEQDLQEIKDKLGFVETLAENYDFLTKWLTSEFERPVKQIEIARMLDKSPAYVSQLTKQPEFPAPIKGTNFWRYSDVFHYYQNQKLKK